jgi:hypothetical protein
LQALHEHHLKAKLAKCDFFKEEVKFIGHIISAKGMTPDPAKVAVVQQWPIPSSLHDVRSFLGLSNYLENIYKVLTAAPVLVLPDFDNGFRLRDRSQVVT